MTQARERYEKHHPHNEWQYELRVRYVPRDMKELLEKDRVTFYYFYDQVRTYWPDITSKRYERYDQTET